MGTQAFSPEEQYRKVAREWSKNRTPDRITVPQDWADDLIKGAATWAYESEIPIWLLKKIENVPNVFLQLPAPDHRWIIKFQGDLWGPFDQQFGGWQDAHDLISERTRTLFGVRLEQTGMAGEATLSGSGGSCADSYPEAVRKRIQRWLRMVSREMGSKMGVLFRKLFSVENGRYTFSECGWMTELGDVPFDASMRLDRGQWVFDVPFCSHELIVPADQNLNYLARILMCGNIPVPAALLEDGLLLQQFQSRPPYRQYFRRTFRKHRIYAGAQDGGETAQAICRIMGLKPGQFFTAYDEIAPDSPLHLICHVPVGPVTLLPNGIRGVQAVVSKQRFLMETVSPQFNEIEQHLRTGMIWVLRYPHLLQQIESESVRARPVISMGLRRLREKLIQMPKHWTTPYDELAQYIKQNVRLGKLCRYSGDVRWKVEGIAPPPDPLELAIDHMAFKRRTAYKEKMRERRATGCAPEPPKPKSEIWQTSKWNASVDAEIAKQAKQPGWAQQNSLAATNGLVG
jgi:hypothetical protein